MALQKRSPFTVPKTSFDFVKLRDLITRATQDCAQCLLSSFPDLVYAERGDENSQQRQDGVAVHLKLDADRGITSKNGAELLLLLDIIRNQVSRLLVLTRWALNSVSVVKAITLRIWLIRKEQDYSVSVLNSHKLVHNFSRALLPIPLIRVALLLFIDAVESLAVNKFSEYAEFLHVKLKRNHETNFMTVFNICNFGSRTSVATSGLRMQGSRAEMQLSSSDSALLSLRELPHQMQVTRVNSGQTLLKVNLSPLERTSCFSRHNLLRGSPRKLSILTRLTIVEYFLGMLGKQANTFTRNGWAKHTLVTYAPQELIIHYWIGMPGPPSRVKFAIDFSEIKLVSPNKDFVVFPSLIIQRFEKGLTLSMQPLLPCSTRVNILHLMRQVLARNTSATFENICRSLSSALEWRDGCVKVIVRTSTRDPERVALFVRDAYKYVIRITQSPRTGKFSIIPPSVRSHYLRDCMNNSEQPSEDAVRLLSGMITEGKSFSL